ncbi:hypothetical protein [Streptomyces sp. NPDC101234]|uniref:hypothetical protein n=1 Tax=Streptomyces sp. NPDC101234 TaxID=3366138 RepID=UPI0038277A7F
METDATVGVDAPKTEAAEVAAQTMDAIESGEPEVLVDDAARRVRAALSGPLDLLHPSV